MPELNVREAILYFEDAAGGGRPVVFMHPASGSSAAWRFQLQPFGAAGYRCITYDLRGWGRSRSTSADPGAMSDDLLALVDHLRLDRFSLVGAAYGGFGALDFALRFPERLQALVLSGTQAGIADPAYTAVRERVVAAPIRALPLDFREVGPSYRTRDPEGVQQWLEIAHAAGEPPPSARQRTHLRIMLPMLEALRVPTLLVGGGADLLAPPELMRIFQAHVAEAKMVVFGEAGHCIHWEQPEAWNREVTQFLNR
ncbi:MAG: alpha/beta hydrolase [Chloroflexi bacterium]|nr:alpha/beta hydrolase [Chloroflexota bacterium]